MHTEKNTMVHQTNAMFCILHSTGNRKGHYRSVIVSIYSPLFHLATYLYKQKEISIYLDRYLSIYLSIYLFRYTIIFKKDIIGKLKAQDFGTLPIRSLVLVLIGQVLARCARPEYMQMLGNFMILLTCVTISEHVFKYRNVIEETKIRLCVVHSVGTNYEVPFGLVLFHREDVLQFDVDLSFNAYTTLSYYTRKWSVYKYIKISIYLSINLSIYLSI